MQPYDKYYSYTINKFPYPEPLTVALSYGIYYIQCVMNFQMNYFKNHVSHIPAVVKMPIHAGFNFEKKVNYV